MTQKLFSFKLIPLGVLAFVLTGLFSLVFIETALACPACNALYKKQIEKDLSETIVGKELVAAMEAQKNLPLDYAEATRHLFTEMEQDSDPDFIEIIERDASLSIPPTSYVDQDVEADVSFTIDMDEGLAYLGNGVIYDGFRINKKIPGPTIRVTEGDIVEIIVQNNGSIPHGASIHAAYTQTSKYLGEIPAGESRSIKFRATHPGVYLYHCAPGGHAIPMHVLFGQYGMMVVEPAEQKFRLEEELGHGPDVEIFLNQHEWYTSGKDAVEGNARYVTFNGDIFRYVKEPIVARPGDYIRINFLNVGPNLLSTFHLVGIIWDYAYWQGHPANVLEGGQTVTAGPSDSWVVEFRMPPDEGAFTMLSHAVGSTSKGAIGLLVGDSNADPNDFPKIVLGDGPEYSEEELAELKEEASRIITPFRPGSPDVDPPVSYGNDTDEVTVRIIGNSYYPKTVDITPGTTVTWINEDVFSFLAGEFSGIHNAVATSGPTSFASPMLAHAESWSYTFEEEGEYTYICTPHPYMEGVINVREVDTERDIAGIMWPMVPALLALVIAVAAWRRNGQSGQE